MTEAAAILDRYRDHLLGLPGVVGVGLGRSATGHPIIEVLTSFENLRAEEKESLFSELPTELEGVPVRVRRIGIPRAQDGN